MINVKVLWFVAVLLMFGAMGSMFFLMLGGMAVVALLGASAGF